jgi:hypothetical protein
MATVTGGEYYSSMFSLLFRLLKWILAQKIKKSGKAWWRNTSGAVIVLLPVDSMRKLSYKQLWKSVCSVKT